MTISWYGEGCFKITENGITIVTDPVDSSTGLSAPRFSHDVVIKTLLPAPKPGREVAATPKDGLPAQTGEPKIISGAGEYEVKGCFISGWPLTKDSSDTFVKNVFRIEIDDMTVGLLGHLTEFNEPEILEELGHIDILIIPGGGKPFIDQEAAAKLIRQISPKVVIPSFFKTPGLRRKAEGVEGFLKEMGIKSATAEEKLTIKKKDLTEKTQVVVLKQ